MTERKRDENGRFIKSDNADPGVAEDEQQAAPEPVRRRIRGRFVQVVPNGEA